MSMIKTKYQFQIQDRETKEIRKTSTTTGEEASLQALENLRRSFLKNGPRIMYFKARSHKFPGQWWHYYFEIDSDSGVRLLGKPLLKSGANVKENPEELPPEVLKKFYPATAQKLGLLPERQTNKRQKKNKNCPTCNENTPEPVRWLGVRWMGVPKPIRWYLKLTRNRSWRHFATEKDINSGCGCIWKLKSAWLYGRKWWLSVRYATQQYLYAIKKA